MQSFWYKDAIIYQIYVPAFCDSNADGIGDVAGLIQKLDYLEELGVSAIWLLGLDLSHLSGATPAGARQESMRQSYGTRQDFETFVSQAHARSMRVITEVAVNLAPPGQRHWTQPALRDSLVQNAGAWLDSGVDGISVDAIPHAVQNVGSTDDRSLSHTILRQLREFVNERYADRTLVAEANQRPEDAADYFGDGDECHMAFNIGLSASLLMALKTEDRRPLTDLIRDAADLPATCQWALFLRNHDELPLSMWNDVEREHLFGAYAQDPQMRVNGGIRRRLAPLLDNDRRRIELAYGLLFSLRGSPVVYYGNEIGMGDNIYLGDCSGMRTPMQWSSDRNAGFSRAMPERLYAAAAVPANADPVYGYQAVNVEAQERQPYSLLNWMRRLISVRNEQHTFGRGTIEFIEARNQKILVYIRRYGDSRILVVANVSASAQSVELLLGRFAGAQPIEMLGGTAFRQIGARPYSLSLAPYGFYWFALNPGTKRDVPPRYRESTLGVGRRLGEGAPPGLAA